MIRLQLPRGEWVYNLPILNCFQKVTLFFLFFSSSILLTRIYQIYQTTLQWRQNERDGVSNHQPHDCLLNHLFRRRSKKASKLRVTGDRWPVNSPHKGPVTRKRFDDVIMHLGQRNQGQQPDDYKTVVIVNSPPYCAMYLRCANSQKSHKDNHYMIHI